MWKRICGDILGSYPGDWENGDMYSYRNRFNRVQELKLVGQGPLPRFYAFEVKETGEHVILHTDDIIRRDNLHKQKEYKLCA